MKNLNHNLVRMYATFLYFTFLFYRSTCSSRTVQIFIIEMLTAEIVEYLNRAKYSNFHLIINLFSIASNSLKDTKDSTVRKSIISSLFSLYSHYMNKRNQKKSNFSDGYYYTCLSYKVLDLLKSFNVKQRNND